MLVLNSKMTVSGYMLAWMHDEWVGVEVEGVEFEGGDIHMT